MATVVKDLEQLAMGKTVSAVTLSDLPAARTPKPLMKTMRSSLTTTRARPGMRQDFMVWRARSSMSFEAWAQTAPGKATRAPRETSRIEACMSPWLLEDERRLGLARPSLERGTRWGL